MYELGKPVQATIEIPDEPTKAALRLVGHDVADDADSCTVLATWLCPACLDRWQETS